MSYSYQAQRANLFTESGQLLFVAWRDRAIELLDEAGAFKHGTLSLPPGIGAAEGWDLLACADRMIELGELHEVTGPDVWGQDRVFVAGRKLRSR
jgi:hypothetical protein